MKRNLLKEKKVFDKFQKTLNVFLFLHHQKHYVLMDIDLK